MNKQDFADWKRHPVTEQVMGQLQSRIVQYTEELIEQIADPAVDVRKLAEKAGAIKAYRDMILIEFEQETE